MDRIAASRGALVYAFGSTLFELRRCCTLRRRLAVTYIMLLLLAYLEA